MQLDPTAKAAGVRLITHDTVSSTNAEALERARSPARASRKPSSLVEPMVS